MICLMLKFKNYISLDISNYFHTDEFAFAIYYLSIGVSNSFFLKKSNSFHIPTPFMGWIHIFLFVL